MKAKVAVLAAGSNLGWILFVYRSFLGTGAIFLYHLNFFVNHVVRVRDFVTMSR